MAKGKLSARYISWLNFGSFPGNCMFIVAFDYEECIKIMKRKKSGDWILALQETKSMWDEPNAGFVSKRTLVTGEIFYFLVLRKKFDFTNDDHHATLAHEVLHLISYHLPFHLDPMEENEAFCYTHTHIMQQCYKILRS